MAGRHEHVRALQPPAHRDEPLRHVPAGEHGRVVVRPVAVRGGLHGDRRPGQPPVGADPPRPGDDPADPLRGRMARRPGPRAGRPRAEDRPGDPLGGRLDGRARAGRALRGGRLAVADAVRRLPPGPDGRRPDPDGAAGRDQPDDRQLGPRRGRHDRRRDRVRAPPLCSGPRTGRSRAGPARLGALVLVACGVAQARDGRREGRLRDEFVAASARGEAAKRICVSLARDRAVLPAGRTARPGLGSGPRAARLRFPGQRALPEGPRTPS